MTNSTVAKKDVQKLQRAIIDGLEDVKAQDIQVFDTEHLSALFERVIIASGTSNRQTKALAASVRDAVRDAGFAKPRVEGETNGEWIIVDCGAAVVHVMQPNFRTYYNLEELWGEKPVRLKFGSAKPASADVEDDEPVKALKKGAEQEQTLRRSNAAKKGVAEAFPSKAQLQKTSASKSSAGKPSAAKSAAKPAAKKPASKLPAPEAPVSLLEPVKAARKLPATAKTAAKPAVKVAAKKVPAQKIAVKRVTINDPVKLAAKKPAAAKKAPAKKAAVRKA
jgi:ribosome-associated protein